MVVRWLGVMAYVAILWVGIWVYGLPGRLLLPQPGIRAGDVWVPAAWTSLCRVRTCVDTPLPPWLLRAQGVLPVTVPPDTRVTITFSEHSLPAHVMVTTWIDAHSGRGFPIGEDGSFEGLSTPGIHTYHLFVRWADGRKAAYAFQIRVPSRAQ